MFLAIAVLLIQPHVASQFSFPAEKVALIQPANSVTNSAPDSTTISPTLNGTAVEEDSLARAPEAIATVSSDASNQPVAMSNSEVLPDAPEPAAAISAPVPIAIVNSGKPMTVTVGALRAENRRNQPLWRGLAIASSGAATFDAWTTRSAISQSGAQELDPMLKPFAGNASLYAAIQVGPALLDFAGKKMMYSRHTWVRRMWWVPQSASFVSSIFCGAHNLSFH